MSSSTDPTCGELDREQTIDLLQCMADCLPPHTQAHTTIVGSGAMLLLGLELDEPASDIDLLYGATRRTDRGVEQSERIVDYSNEQTRVLKEAAFSAVTLYRVRHDSPRPMPHGVINNSFDGCKMMPQVMFFEHNIAFQGAHDTELRVHIPEAQSLLATRFVSPRFVPGQPLAPSKDSRAVEKLLWLDGIDPDDPEMMLGHMLAVSKLHFKPDAMLNGPMRYTAQRMGVLPARITYRPLDLMCDMGAKALVRELRSQQPA